MAGGAGVSRRWAGGSRSAVSLWERAGNQRGRNSLHLRSGGGNREGEGGLRAGNRVQGGKKGEKEITSSAVILNLFTF